MTVIRSGTPLPLKVSAPKRPAPPPKAQRPAKSRKKRRPKKKRTPKPARTADDPKYLRIRNAHLKVYPECRVCGTTEHPNVHHMRYRGYGNERPGDLVTLCRTHHKAFHDWWRDKTGKTTSVAGTLAFIKQHRA